MLVKERLKAEFEKELKGLIRSLMPYQPEKIILFGSFARNDFHEGSDIDIIIIKETSKRFLDRIGDILALYQGRQGLEVLVYTPQEVKEMLAHNNPFMCQVMAEGKVVYEQK